MPVLLGRTFDSGVVRRALCAVCTRPEAHQDHSALSNAQLSACGEGQLIFVCVNGATSTTSSLNRTGSSAVVSTGSAVASMGASSGPIWPRIACDGFVGVRGRMMGDDAEAPIGAGRTPARQS